MIRRAAGPRLGAPADGRGRMSALDIALATLRGFASCRGDDACIDEADAELAELRGEIKRLRAVLQAIKNWEIDRALTPDSGRETLFALPTRLRALIQTALEPNP